MSPDPEARRQQRRGGRWRQSPRGHPAAARGKGVGDRAAYLATGVGGGEADLPGGGSGGAADELRTSSRIAAALAPGRVKEKRGRGRAGRSAGRVVWSDLTRLENETARGAFTSPALHGDGRASCYRGLAPLISRSVPFYTAAALTKATGPSSFPEFGTGLGQDLWLGYCVIRPTVFLPETLDVVKDGPASQKKKKSRMGQRPFRLMGVLNFSSEECGMRRHKNQWVKEKSEEWSSGSQANLNVHFW